MNNNRWHLNCDDCHTNADATGTAALELLLKIGELHHDETGHVLSLWPHGQRDTAEKIGRYDHEQ